MTEPTVPPASPEPRIATPTGGHAERVSTVARYLETNRDRFTEDALVRAARDAGYPEDVLDAAKARARASAAAAPVRQRARRWILIAYLATFAVLTAGMLLSEYSRQYGASYIGTVVLAAALGLAFLLSLGWLRWRGSKVEQSTAGVALLLSVPVVLLVVVAGSCLATGLPIPRPY
jgi:cation transport ATPase